MISVAVEENVVFAETSITFPEVISVSSCFNVARYPVFGVTATYNGVPLKTCVVVDVMLFPFSVVVPSAIVVNVVLFP